MIQYFIFIDAAQAGWDIVLLEFAAGCFLRNRLYIFIAERKTGKDFGMDRSRRIILALFAVMVTSIYSRIN